MMMKAILVLALALGLTGIAAGDRNDPIPHCWPCPYSN
jgi:hypothetical protein